ncbi:MAG: Uncharacterised protein [Glaciecola sp. HTCC2999]|nr:MAG: Uncharacterised protein [Glaciecola sp. HTCC2999]
MQPNNTGMAHYLNGQFALPKYLLDNFVMLSHYFEVTTSLLIYFDT